jgi:regulator of ribonuclease activity A
MATRTADLCDQYRDRLQVLDPIFRSYGGRRDFSGRIVTVNVHEDNVLVRAALEKNGAGQVLVIDGGGSLRSALVGGNVAKLAADNQWSGMLIYGCIRDATEVAALDIGVLALATCPVKPKKNGFGETGIAAHFAGAKLSPGDYVYVDEDGVVVASEKLD